MSTAIDGWYDSGRGLIAWFAASSHAHAASLVEPVLDLVGDRGPWPLLDVRGTGVRVRLSRACPDSPALAASLTTAALRLGLHADPQGSRALSVVIESADPPRISSFWRTALDHDLLDGGTRLCDPLDRHPDVALERAEDVGPLRNRLHLDVGHPGPVAEPIASALASGGTERFTCEWYATVADADGNEVDIVPGGPIEQEPSVADWRAMFGGMTCYPEAAVEQAVRLVQLAGDHADRAGLPLLIDIRPEGVVLDSGKDRWEHPDFSELASRLQHGARSLGLSADPERLRFVQVGIDAVDVPTVRDFWRAVLGYREASDPRITDLIDPHDLDPVLFFQEMEDDDDRRRQRSRIRLRLRLPADLADVLTQTALAHDGRVLDERTIADPEGNELTITRLSPARAA